MVTKVVTGSALWPRLDAPDARLALDIAGETATYAQLADRCAAYRRDLDARGVRPGARLPVTTHPTLDTAVAIVGNMLHGVVTVPVNPKLGERERDHIATDSRTGDLPADAALILYTSGTTGPPKGAVITTANIAANLDALAACWQWTEADNVVHALPLFHVHGLVLGLFGALRAGGALVHPGHFSPPELADALTHDGTMLFAVPTMYRRLLDAAADMPAIGAALASARLLVSGSAGLPTREHDRMRDIAGCAIYERYGLTETLINCGVDAAGPPRPSYVGPHLAGVELRLVDDDRAPIETLDDATIGEVAVRGANVFAGYLNRPDATAAVRDADGWFYTGDLATRTADGAVRIVGRRATDLIKTGGYKVGAGEVEACLLEHADVADVAVVGAPDDDLGQRIMAFVVPAPGTTPNADALTQHVADQLSPHKRPRAVSFVDELPRNAMGKVQKKRLLPGS